MFLELAHTKPDIFRVSREMTLTCYKYTLSFSIEEKSGMISQIRRAALSVHLNIAESSSGRSVAERRRFDEIACGSFIEVDTALEVAVSLNYTSKEKLAELGGLIKRCFQMLSKMMSG